LRVISGNAQNAGYGALQREHSNAGNRRPLNHRRARVTALTVDDLT
jgi:hypothetical protein